MLRLVRLITYREPIPGPPQVRATRSGGDPNRCAYTRAAAAVGGRDDNAQFYLDDLAVMPL